MKAPHLSLLLLTLFHLSLPATQPRQPGEASPRGVAFFARYKSMPDPSAKPSQAQLNLQRRMREQRNSRPVQTPRISPPSISPANLSADRRAYLQFLHQQHLELENEAHAITFSGDTHTPKCPDFDLVNPDNPIPAGHACIRRRLRENEYQQSRLLGIRTPTTTISKRAFKQILESNNALRAQGIQQELPWQGTHLIIE